MQLRAEPWRSGPSDDGRAYLQTRMTLFSRLMFWSIVALLVFLTAMYRTYPAIEPAIEPAHNDVIFAGASSLLGVMLILWRVVLLRRPLSVRALYGLDVIYAIGIGGAFAVSALLATDLRPAGYAALMYAAFTVFMRAIVVPSSGRRTAIVSVLVFVPLWTAGVILALETEQEVPAPAFVVGALVLGTVPILLASVGSDIIYGLRRQVSEAMQLGQYTLEAKIGEGGNGAVYRAHHALLRRPTAIKLLPDHRPPAVRGQDRGRRLHPARHPAAAAAVRAARRRRRARARGDRHDLPGQAAGRPLPLGGRAGRGAPGPAARRGLDPRRRDRLVGSVPSQRGGRDRRERRADRDHHGRPRRARRALAVTSGGNPARRGRQPAVTPHAR